MRGLVGQIKRRLKAKEDGVGEDEWRIINMLRDDLAGIAEYGINGRGCAAIREQIGEEIRHAKIQLLLLKAAVPAIKEEDKVKFDCMGRIPKEA